MAVQQKVREHELAMAVAHQQQAQQLHGMAVNALVSGVSVEEVMTRSGLPRDVALEVAKRMMALSQASAGAVAAPAAGPLAAAAAARRLAAADAQNDSLTMAMIREQTILHQQQLQNAAFRFTKGSTLFVR